MNFGNRNVQQTIKKCPKLLLVVLSSLLLLYLLLSGLSSSPPRTDMTKQRGKTIAGQCPARNVVFIKTHKTGSSTMTNILLRYTENHRLNQLMGRFPTNTEYYDLRQHHFPGPPAGESYNSFCMHADYDPAFFRSIMPADTKLFTFVRQPTTRYISGFSFFGYSSKYSSNLDTAINKHIDANSRYLVDTVDCENCGKLVNSVAFDLGFDFERYTKSDDRESVIREFLSERDAELDLVLVSEWYDLSLVLLARRFCWTFDDIVYQRDLESKHTVRPKVSAATTARLAEFQQVDWALYRHFNTTFWEQVRKEEGIFAEVEEFKKYNAAVKTRCFKETLTDEFKTWKHDLTELGRTDFQCLAMGSGVMPFIHLIQKRNEGYRSDGIPRPLTLEDLYKMRRDGNSPANQGRTF